ncbi:Hypothetical predicted protein [Olea europaea subsp. europaea]|uniref:Uncharacterized protein n=1 Tax=Olea europaea subsp. europaea TaxID=158383 RepID=A0A8S0TZQ0_OLEEU|nr:Hypothetical predicted protein [Olea europaea subsp. europaea]
MGELQNLAYAVPSSGNWDLMVLTSVEFASILGSNLGKNNKGRESCHLCLVPEAFRERQSLVLTLHVKHESTVFIAIPSIAVRRFNYSTTFSFKYRDGIIGEAPIPAGNKRARSTQTMNDDTNRICYSQVPMCIPDLLSSTLPLQTYVTFSGK